MLQSQTIELRRSQIRGRLGEIAGLAGDEYSEVVQGEEKDLQLELTQSETRLRSALLSESETSASVSEVNDDVENRERLELRSRARLANYFEAAARGRQVTGAESELAAAANVDGIPFEIFETETRAVTPSPATVGVNLDTFQPAVFSPSIAPMLGIEMPQVGSGTYATGTITTSATASAQAKGAAIAATAGAITVQTASPKRISARLELRIEDVAAVGQQNFESVLRENVSLALSDALDNATINGDGSGATLTGLFQRLMNPTAHSGTSADTFDTFAAVHAGGIDGLWATGLDDVRIMAGVETYQVSARTFRGVDGPVSAASYAMSNTGGWMTNKRMPSAASNIQQAILYRMGRSGMRTAVCPHWGYVGIDDIYSGSASGTRSYTLHVLLGDVILVQPDAYSQVSYRVA